MKTGSITLGAMTLLGSALMTVATPTAHAVVTVNSASDVAPSGGAVHDVYTPSAFAASGSDLAEGVLATYDGDSTYELSAGVGQWTNGSISTVYNEPGPGGDATDHASYGSVTNDTNATFDLGGLYDISQVDVYAGWNDSGRDLFSFDLLFSADDMSYATYATFLKGGDNTGAFTTPVTTQISIADDSGDLALGVRYVRLRIFDTDNGAAGIVEVDVLGAGVVPEPTSVVVAGLACLMIGARGVSRSRN